jgi:hypothetical protein
VRAIRKQRATPRYGTCAFRSANRALASEAHRRGRIDLAGFGPMGCSALRRIGLLHTLYAKNDLWHDPPKFLEIRAPAHQCAAHQDRHGRESPHSTNFDLAHTGPTLAER